jgi:acetylornithine deacetylase
MLRARTRASILQAGKGRYNPETMFRPAVRPWRAGIQVNTTMRTSLPDAAEMLTRLVALPSVSSQDPRLDTGNRPIIDQLASWLDDLGFACEVMPIPGRPAKFNLIARRGDGDDGLVLSGHTDTVPFDADGWASDPFCLSEREGRLYGLGSADMKGFFPCVLHALASLELDRLRRPLTLLATADEESSMSGAKALVDAGRVLGRHAVIGEPTGLQPIRMHKGVLMVAVRIHGRAGHASNPALGNNALDGMVKVMGAMMTWRERLRGDRHDPLFQVAFPTLNLGHIHGGDSPNRICADCELQLDMRLLPGMDLDEVLGELRRLAEVALADSGLTLSVEPLFEGVPPLCTAADAEVVQVAEALSGRPAGTVAFATEGPYLHRLGMETVILGAGDIECAHQPNEYVPVEQLGRLTEIVAGMVRHFCGK